MGPPREHGGEPVGKWAGSRRPAKLQWGRRANTAERLKSETRAAVHRSFNGAAARTRRRGATNRYIELAMALLQWGRRANTAESRTKVVEFVVERLASMGPPREHGGELAESELERARALGFNGAAARTRRRVKDPKRDADATFRLQWGRRANTAESPRCAGSTRPRCRRFNGAAARTRRREEAGASAKATKGRLQWGRRANTAERSVPWYSGESADTCFNGAAARTRRRAPCPRQRSFPWSSFNGAAARTRRRGRARSRPAASASCFNGAAARTRRRGWQGRAQNQMGQWASMGPPREHGGEAHGPVAARREPHASMGPPREHGGERPRRPSGSRPRRLQWGRRANTAESPRAT